MTYITEDKIELYNLELLENLGYHYLHGSQISPENPNPERQNISDVLLQQRLITNLQKINPDIPITAIESAIRDITNINSSDPIANNRTFHQYLTEGINIEYQKDGETRGEQVWLIDWQNPDNNEFLAVNQLTIREEHHPRRPDIILFINGLPLVVIELKNAADQKADTYKAFNQLQTYRKEIPSLFIYNALLVISDGLTAKAGSISAKYNRFLPWKIKDQLQDQLKNQSTDQKATNGLEILTTGMLNKTTLLDLIRHFTVFEETKIQDPKTAIIHIQPIKKIAAYHQYYAVNKAVARVIEASGLTENSATSTTATRKTKYSAAKNHQNYLAADKYIPYHISQAELQENTARQIKNLRGKADRKGGVIWHTQGSGKSLSMVFLTGKLVLSHALHNPTIVMITDRNDLDDQLFDTFADCCQLLRQEPQQANNRETLQNLLTVASGGIVFTTIQKFAPSENESIYPQLSDRPNIIVIADEAHRSQYGFQAKQADQKDKTGKVIGKQTKYGFARYLRDALPQATFIGFTGTPIEQADKNTPEVFGNYIDIYDIAQAVEDGATVPIYYESRLVTLNINDSGRQLLAELDEDLQFEELTTTQKAKAKATQLEALVGATARLRAIAQDIVNHFSQRQKVNQGKGMIVTMSRRIAANLYDQIIEILPDWHSDDLKKGKIKVVMTASADDEANLVKHHTTKADRQLLAQRLKDINDPLEMVIVCDMWLTGFDAPCLHTMYIDKPLKGHNLMQAIARINRVYFEKQGGLVVDYLGLATELKKALNFYAESGGRGEPTLDQTAAVNLLLTKIEIIEQILHGFPYQSYFTATTADKLNILIGATDFVCQPQLKERFLPQITALSKAYSLAVPHPEALAQSEKISFFQAIQASIHKLEPQDQSFSNREMETAIRQVVDQALVSKAVINILDQAGIKDPDISIISPEFIAEVRGMPHQNLAVALLEKLLNDQIKSRKKVNLAQSRELAKMLEASLRRYYNQAINITDVIEELLKISQDIVAADQRGEKLGLATYELAFYDALAQNNSAVEVMGVDILKTLAIALTEKIKKNVSIDWNLKESARASMKIMVKRLLRQYGYPPDMEALAIDLVLDQAKVFTEYTFTTSTEL
jgi:type I restriction enzyme R subunit